MVVGGGGAKSTGISGASLSVSFSVVAAENLNIKLSIIFNHGVILSTDSRTQKLPSFNGTSLIFKLFSSLLLNKIVELNLFFFKCCFFS